MTPVDVSLGQSHRTLRTVSCGKRQAAGGRRQAAGGRRIDLCLGELCTRGILICAHAVGLWPSLRGGGPDRTGRLFAALIRRVRSMEFSPHGLFPCPRSLRTRQRRAVRRLCAAPAERRHSRLRERKRFSANTNRAVPTPAVIRVWVLIYVLDQSGRHCRLGEDASRHQVR